MKEQEEVLRARLRQAGLRVTDPRVEVLRLLVGRAKPLSHAEAVELLEHRWDPATVYRNLVKLVQANLARSSSTPRGVTLYLAQPAGEPSWSFACVECGDSTSLPSKPALRYDEDPAWAEALRDASARLLGLCPQCRAQAPNLVDPPQERGT
jgi:Fur family ferric uptake transcriptional regulator